MSSLPVHTTWCASPDNTSRKHITVSITATLLLIKVKITIFMEIFFLDNCLVYNRLMPHLSLSTTKVWTVSLSHDFDLVQEHLILKNRLSGIVKHLVLLSNRQHVDRLNHCVSLIQEMTDSNLSTASIFGLTAHSRGLIS